MSAGGSSLCKVSVEAGGLDTTTMNIEDFTSQRLEPAHMNIEDFTSQRLEPAHMNIEDFSSQRLEPTHMLSYPDDARLHIGLSNVAF